MSQTLHTLKDAGRGSGLDGIRLERAAVRLLPRDVDFLLLLDHLNPGAVCVRDD